MVIKDERLTEFSNLISENKCNKHTGRLKAEVDLGTANIVLSIVDENNTPIVGASYKSNVIKDGIIVDFVGTINVVDEPTAAASVVNLERVL
jgi:ethanolamine utilization protein EutJ